MKRTEQDVTIIRCCEPKQEGSRRSGINPQLKEFMTAVIRLIGIALSSIGAAYLMGWAH